MSHALIAGISGPKFRSCFEAMSRWSSVLATSPTTVWVGMDKMNDNDILEWRTWLLNTSTDSAALWKNEELDVLQSLSITPGSEITTCNYPRALDNVRQVIALLEPLPFEICSLGSIYFEQW